jgi:elongation factor G
MLGDSEFFAEVEVDFSPLPPGAQPFAISTSLRDEQQLPKKFVAAAKKALEDALRTGGNHGYPLIYVAANLRRLVIDEQKTTEGAITGAILQAVNQVIKSAGTAVLEPVMRLEIIAPDTVIGEITAYLQPRRAVIREMAQLNLGKRIDCEVPLAEMFGFGKALPKLSGGRASFSMEPHGFQEVSSEAAARLFGIS